ncbi:MAG: ABC transporter substrate-binding protein, partial [Lachnospiraceae bacterium]|nr:ABC transporter substrate-binding protein [Lachnospiraceae bacterium]
HRMEENMKRNGNSQKNRNCNRKKNFLKACLALAAAVGMAAITACGNVSSSSGSSASAAGPDSSAPEGSRHLNVALFWVSTTLDPADGYNGWVLSRIGAGETLLRLDMNASLEPCLADSWEQTDENTWVFHIREDVTFSNGKPVDAKACMDSIQRAFDLNDRAEEYFRLDRMTAEGQTLTIRTKEPSGAVLNNLCEPLFTIVDVNPDVEASGGDVSGNQEDGNDVEREMLLDTAPGCTGPYIIRSFAPESKVELVKNEHYWDGEPGLDTITINQVADSDSRVMAMQSGEADLTTTIDNTSLALFSDESRYTIYETIGPRTNVVYMNNKSGFLSDPAIRQAVSYGVDRRTYAELIGGEPGVGLYSTALPCGRDITDTYAWNPEAAEQLLDGAGYADTDGDGIREKDGQNIVLQYYLSADHGSSDAAIIAQAIQSDVQKIGIGMELVQTENLSDIKSSHSFDLCSANDSTAPTADPEVFLLLHYLTGASANYGEYSNGEVDQMIRQLQTVFGPQERQKLAHEISQKILDDAACLYISYIKGNTVTASRVKNARQFPIDYYIITKDITVE